MSIYYHGSPILFDHFDLSSAGEGTGIKYGFGVYLTESYESAVHYSQPRHLELTLDHYIYTVKIPDLTTDNHLVSAKPVEKSIIERVEAKLGCKAPDEEKTKGKLFRKWIGMTITGSKKNDFASEKAAAELLDSLGVFYMVWPTAQTKPDGDKNIAVFNPSRVEIIKCDRIDIVRRGDKWILKEDKKR